MEVTRSHPLPALGLGTGTNMPTTKEIAWLAGLLEGEGCFVKHPCGNSIRIHLGMTDRDVVERAAKIWGKSVRGPYQPNGPLSKQGRLYKPMYTTAAGGWVAAAWMMMLYGFMGERRKARIREMLTVWRRGIQWRRNGDYKTPPECHPERPYFADKKCKSCYESTYKKTWRTANPERLERIRAYDRSRSPIRREQRRLRRLEASKQLEMK